MHLMRIFYNYDIHFKMKGLFMIFSFVEGEYIPKWRDSIRGTNALVEGVKKHIKHFSLCI